MILDFPIEVDAEGFEGGTATVEGFTSQGIDFGTPCDDGATLSHDTGFFASDLVGIFSEVFGMVESDGGDDAQARGERVGGVESPAESDFEDAELDMFFLIESEGHHEAALEVGEGDAGFWGFAAEVGEDLISDFDDFGFRDEFAIDAHAFAKLDEMRGGKEAGLKTCAVECGGPEGAALSFSVGSRDEDMGVIDDVIFSLECGVDGIESQFDDAFVLMEQSRIEVRHRLSSEVSIKKDAGEMPTYFVGEVRGSPAKHGEKGIYFSMKAYRSLSSR